MSLTVCFTGHRTIPREDRLWLAAAAEREIRRLIAAGADCFRAGGAFGFDTVAALKVLELKKEYPGIRLELKLPCRDQDKRWSDYDRMVYRKILNCADDVEYISETYTPSCMFARNRALVKGSDVCIAYLKKTTGGTAYTVQYAESGGVKVIRLTGTADGVDKPDMA